ncbi:MAG: nucleotidyltransferase family protein [Gammaproteobacteria bacterium]
MRAMILAAGRGERMRPLTDRVPKPLLEVGNKPLIQHQLEALRRAGIAEFVINVAGLGNQICDYLGDGSRFDVNITYSNEGNEPLETAGGIIKVLDFFQQQPFVVTNADIYTEFDYRDLPETLDSDAHLVLVNNPPHHPDGDFSLQADKLGLSGETRFTFSGIGVYQPRLFAGLTPGHRKLAPILYEAAAQGRINGQLYTGYWNDIGTPDRLAEVNKALSGA